MEHTLPIEGAEPLGIGWLLLATVLKIAFILSVSLLFFAPVFVLFERRQSAMVQDRVGPMQGGIKLPRIVIDNLPSLQLGALGAGVACTVLTIVCFVQIALGNGENVLFREPIFGVAHTWNGFFFVFALLAPVHLVLGGILPELFTHDRLTIFGGLHALFDAIKAFTKRDFVPPNGDKLLFALAPIIAMVPAFALGAVLPFGPTLYPGHLLDQAPPGGFTDGTAIPLQVASLNMGILYMFALGGTGIIGAALAGYASDNKFSLLGGLRAASQMVSYEVVLGLSLVGCFMVYDSLRLEDMVQWQADHVWGVFVQPLAFVLFFTASIAEYKRVPFDAPEGESEIVAGYFLEYASGKWLMYMIGEFLEVGTSSMLIATLFFGGWDVPFLQDGGWELMGHRFDLLGTNFAILSEVLNSHIAVTLIRVVAFVLKAFVLGVVSIQVRWTLPRFRYDQIMQLCWKLILPLALVNVLVTGIFILWFQG
ncbi:MAG: complex I subunit 1 family protein [Sandaracinus sp.]